MGPLASRRASRNSHGFTYIGVLIFVAVMGITLAGTGMVFRTQKKRENERELLFIGEQYRRAIGQYFERSPGGKQFPKSIDELLLDRRYPTVQHYLRRPYVDPMTGKAEWGLITGPEGGIMGVYSLSEGVPLMQNNFKSEFAPFEGALHYGDWQFVYVTNVDTKLPVRPASNTR